MATRRGKRKGPCQDMIFEISDNDMSPEHNVFDDGEPEVKIMKPHIPNTEVSDSNLKCNVVIDNSFNIDTQNETVLIEDDCNTKGEDSQDETVLIEDNCNTKGEDSSMVVDSQDVTIVIEENSNTKDEDSCGKAMVVPSESLDLNNTAVYEEVTTIISESDLTSDVEIIESQTVQFNKKVESGKTENLVHTECNTNLEDGECDDTVLETSFTDAFTTIDAIDETVDNAEETVIENPEESVIEVENSDEKSKKSFISIQFSDTEIASMYKFKILDLIKALKLQIELEDDLSLKAYRIENKDISIVDLVTPNATPAKKHKKKKSKKNDLFVLDTKPSDEDYFKPNYSSKFLIDTGKKDDDDIECKKTQTCFNCDGDHSLRECPIPKDFARINENKKNFQQKKQPERYHVENTMYPHLKPGRISNSLKEALGLRKNQLPSHIYSMRMLGYPPGWLEEAKCVHSNLELFDIDGKNVKNSESNKEVLDPEKIINYPGFNVPLEKGFKDEYKLHNTPPYSSIFNKEVMIEHFTKLVNNQKDNFESCYMELDTTNFDDSMDTSKANESLKDFNDISINTLEQKKIQLLAELNQNVDSPLPAEQQDKDSTENLSEQTSICPVTTEITTVTVVKNVTGTSFGTPILKSSSPYLRLPNPDNFSKDVSPIINFENLPNSTGKYEQMTGVLQKVRDTLKKTVQNCSS